MIQTSILAFSDLHGHFPEVDFLHDNVDVVMVAGDITDKGTRDIPVLHKAQDWMQKLVEKYKNVYWVPGNHDIGILDNTFAGTCLKNRTAFLDVPGERSLKMWGNSMSVCYSHPKLASIFEHMTDDITVEENAFSGGLNDEWYDVFLTHSPPFGINDYVGRRYVSTEEEPGIWRNEHIGSPSLLEQINKHCPTAVIHGHAHSRGITLLDTPGTTVYNVSREEFGMLIYV